MNRILKALLISLFLLGNGVLRADDYHLGAGDLLSVLVFGEEDLSLKEVRVSTKGSISFPLLGDISVKNMTPQELEALLTKKLLDGYLKKPEVSVSVLEYRPFYVHGEVKKPGGYSYTSNLTVEKAIVLAGGLTERASKGKITILRENSPKETPVSAGLNVAVKPGDVITVGESFF
jgi:protein involved in polysaccharide export with SLBB domain